VSSAAYLTRPSPSDSARRLPHYQPGPVPALNYSDLPAARSRAVTLDAGTDQAHVYVAAPLPGIATDDRAALRVLNAILGRSSGRLFTEIRDKRGLAYSAYSIVQQFPDGGAFVGVRRAPTPPPLTM